MNTATQREEDLYATAQPLTDAAERRAFLDRGCAGDPALRARIEELLAAEQDAERFFTESGSALNLPAAALSFPLNTPASAEAIPANLSIEEPVGTRIGRYKLLERIGEGGCGVVYMAEQEEPVRRRVALKIIKLGMETKSVIARFEAERQALALMDHPNIARVFDAGATERGSPYFVMELVRGVRITEYCEQNHLGIRQRLDLFVQICHAIQHAHQKGVIHRDIKPSNIMIALQDGVPVPKIIDFGIAKATEARLVDRPLLTADAQLIGTPAYMSPEQAEMSRLDIDTRSDIYSLGVLLYELLTGFTPFDPKKLLESGIDEMRRTIREQEPPRPSARLTGVDPAQINRVADRRQTESGRLIALLRGDLDWVVMKALEKDRNRRYETANGLAMDIRHYLNYEAISARPPTWIYRLKKLVRRNRVVFAAGSAVAAALVIGFGATTWLFLREREARQRAVLAEQQQARLRHEAEERAKVTRASLFVSQEKYDEADALLSQISLTEPNVEGAAVFRSVGEWHAVHQRWRQAAEHFTRLLQLDQLDGWDVSTLDVLRLGPALIEIADDAGYERFRQAVIAHYLASPCPASDRIVKVSLLRPLDEQALTTLRPVAETTAKFAADADARGEAFQAAWRSLSMSLWEYRRGDFEAAAEWARRCLSSADFNAPRSATAHEIMAMALQKSGRQAQAGAELAKAVEILDAKFRHGLDLGSPMQGFWFDWEFAWILLPEVRSVVEGG